MSRNPDPSFHQAREKQFFEHVQSVVESGRLPVNTTKGMLNLSELTSTITTGEKGVERGEKLKRQMMQLGISDRAKQSQMPVGERLHIKLRRKTFWLMKKDCGDVSVVTISPQKALLTGAAIEPTDVAEVNALLKELIPSEVSIKQPQTVILMSTAGFSPAAAGLAGFSGGQSVILAEPNDAGGWKIIGPTQTSLLTEILDPEKADAKRARIEQFISDNNIDIITGGINAEKIANRTELPLELVESELKLYVKKTAGLSAKRISGKLMLFREGSAYSEDSGGSNMPFWEKVTGIFKREESTDKKIGRLTTERASLTQHREQAYEEIAAVEKKEHDLTKSFKDATALTQKRIATEISQIRKDIERRQQILATVDKKINVINTGIHNLELQSQLSPEKLKQLENVATSSEEVEVGMAALQQLDEDANTAAGIGTNEIPDDVQAILDELKGKTAEPAAPEKDETQAIFNELKNKTATKPESTPAAKERRRNEPEAG